MVMPKAVSHTLGLLPGLVMLVQGQRRRLRRGKSNLSVPPLGGLTRRAPRS